MKNRLLRRLYLPGLALLLPLLILYSGYLYYHSLITSILDEAVKDETGKADVIIVFGAAIAAGGRPSRVLQSRINRAFELYKKKMAQQFILTGGIGWGPPAESVVMKRELVRMGIPEQSIFLETRSRSTREQVTFAIRTCRSSGWKSALLVSDPFHIYRLKIQFQGSGIRVRNSAARSLPQNQTLFNRYLRMEVLKTLAWHLFDH